ncbi:hypothetical protein DXG01_006554 [Tephrocybe rancida]|nr:hypothetical protein DXG01_006554 [Tephrocybe rancida]
MQFLDSLIPGHIPGKDNVVKLYNSMMSIDYRKKLISDYQDSSKSLRVVIATDTCTYGLDLPNVRRVIVFDMCPSPENLKQKTGRAGRDGKPAIAITFAPTWVREVEDSEPKGKQAQEDLKRRCKLPLVTRQWYNPTPSLCPRFADLQYNGEVFCLCKDCCSIHFPEPEESRDLAMVARWAQHFDELTNPAGERVKQLRTDHTYHEPTRQMKGSLEKLLSRWRSNTWASLRGSRIGDPPNIFMPQHILLRIADRAHICSTLERLGVICDGWEYFESHGAILLRYLEEIMVGFNEMFEEDEVGKSEREGMEDEDEDEQRLQEEQDVTVEQQRAPVLPTARSIRLVLQPKNQTPNVEVTVCTGKRDLRSTEPPTQNKRARKAANKENEQ